MELTVLLEYKDMYFSAKKQAGWALSELIIYLTCKLGYVEQCRRQLAIASSVLAVVLYFLGSGNESFQSLNKNQQ